MRRTSGAASVGKNQQGGMMDGQPILICYDGSESSVRSIQTAAELLTGRTAVVVDIGPVLTGAESYAAIAPGVDVELLQKLNLDGASERAEEGAKLARRAGFDAAPRAELSAPTWEGILYLADEVDAAVIVIGSRHLNAVRELFEGSVSHALAEHSKRPTLIIPPNGKS
jgi:nucleotide-binding universal stress UspA family protein